MVVLIGSFGQLSGNGLITYFLPVLLLNAGITSQSKQLTLNFVNSITSFIGALTVSSDPCSLSFPVQTKGIIHRGQYALTVLGGESSSYGLPDRLS